MTDLGVWSDPQPATPPPDPQPSSNVPIWLIVLAVAVALGLVGVLFVSLTHHSAPTKEVVFPDTWDSRIEPYVKIAEKERGLHFLHPVAVRFLAPAAFEKGVTSDEKKLKASDREQLRQFTGMMRALGLIKGDLNLFRAMNQFNGSGTLAYYSFDDKRITVRGKQITPAVGSTLVHELTHVLQDQNFDVGDRLLKLRKQDDKGPTTSASSVLDAIVEGDAERVQGLYHDSLPAKQRRALDASQRSEFKHADKALKQIPKVIVTMETSSYTLGQALVETVAAKGGNRAVNGLFSEAPTHETSLLDPFRVLAGQAGARKLEVPKVRAGEKKFDSGELGVLTWYLMLAERLPLKDALAAADGWAGDSYVAFDRGGRSCTRMSYAGHTVRAATVMASDLRRWVAAAPGSPASVTRAGGLVHFESCDPGTSATVGRDSSETAVGLLTTRTYLGVSFVRAGVPQKVARCLAGRMVQDYKVKQLVNPRFGAGDPAVQNHVRQLALGCRASTQR